MDTLPAGLEDVTSNTDDGSYSATNGRWNVGRLGSDTDATLTITTTVEEMASSTNTAQVNTSNTFDPDSTPGNDNASEDDQDSATLQPTAPQCSIQLGNVNAPDSVSQGDEATITANVTNTGLKDGCGANATLNVTGNSTRAVDIPLLIDTSGSTQPYIDKIANQLGDFANDLNAQGIDARFGVISYGGNGYVTVNQNYTNDSDKAIAALNDLNPDGGVERNYGAIQAAFDQYKSLETGRRTKDLAADLDIPDVRVVANKVRDEQDREAIEEFCGDHDLEIAAVVPFDDAIRHADQDGTAPFDYNPDAEAVRAIRDLADDLAASYVGMA